MRAYAELMTPPRSLLRTFIRWGVPMRSLRPGLLHHGTVSSKKIVSRRQASAKETFFELLGRWLLGDEVPIWSGMSRQWRLMKEMSYASVGGSIVRGHGATHLPRRAELY